MKRYLVWIYTKHGQKKRYETDTIAIVNPETGNLTGTCLKSGITFVVPLANVDIYEWQEIIDGQNG